MKRTTANKFIPKESIISKYLFESDFYNIKNWSFDFQPDQQINKGYNDCLCFVYVRNGQYLFGQSIKQYDMHTGHIIIEKGNYEYSIRPSFGAITIFNFTDAFYQQFLEELNLKNDNFFSNPNLISQVIQSTPEMEYLHFQLLNKVINGGKLEVDSLVLELFHKIVDCMNNRTRIETINNTYFSFHLSAIEAAKEFMLQNFSRDISLLEISKHCAVSLFHFSRLFKNIVEYSPYQYLGNIRLMHGEQLLKNSIMSIAEIAFACGFGSAEHFTTTFKQKYKSSPSNYRKSI